MSKIPQRIIPWLAAAAVAVSLSACGTPDAGEPTAPDSIVPSMFVEESVPPEALDPEPSDEPVDPIQSPSEEVFEGEPNTDTITANMMEMQIPAGIKIPEDTLVTKAEPPNIMMADEDPSAVVAMVESSAAEAGYEVYAEIPGGKVFVGNGNAVHFTAGEGFQILSWGPEAMKDVLAGS